MNPIHQTTGIPSADLVSSMASASTAPEASSSRPIEIQRPSRSDQQSPSRQQSSSQGRVTKKRLYDAVPSSNSSHATSINAYRSELEAWVSRASKSEYPSREQAADICENCFLQNEEVLEFPAGNLAQLPPLPKNIKKLKVVGNELQTLPDHWPVNLQEINVSANKLKKIVGRNLPKNLRVLNFSRNGTQRLYGPFYPDLRKIVASHNKFVQQPHEWPDNLEELDLHRSQLTSFPSNLPSELRVLDLSSNQIGEIGQYDLPYGLEKLNIAKTAISTIPEDLPEGLLELDLSGNYFDYLPEFLPASLTYVNLTNSNLEVISDCLKNLSSNAEVDLVLNPLSEEALEERQDMLNSAYGPYFKISDEDISLRQAVSSWFDSDDTSQASRADKWRGIQSNQHSRRDAQAFSTFLVRLRETQEYKNPHSQSQFIHRVKTLLSALELDPPLRKTCISIACEALETCDDRIAISFDNMELEVINADAEKGRYSQDALFELGEQMMRLNDLNQIALSRLASMENGGRDVDEVEVLLAYRSGLAEKLNLPNQTKSMFFASISNVSNDDLTFAKREVDRRQGDLNHMIDFFVSWRPWQRHLQRTKKTEFDKLEVEMQDAKEKLLDAQFELDQRNQTMNSFEYRRCSQDLLDQNNMIDLSMPDKLRRQLTREYILRKTFAKVGSRSY